MQFMPDNFIIDNLQGILDSIELIEIRFAGIAQPDNLVMNADGVLVLDSICMRLQVIGELLKKIDKINAAIWERYPQIEWPNIIKLRDIISHHYTQVDHEIIYDICQNNLPDLKKVVQQMIGDLASV
jgi:uncharacterized protein with HEPN domain